MEQHLNCSDIYITLIRAARVICLICTSSLSTVKTCYYLCLNDNDNGSHLGHCRLCPFSDFATLLVVRIQLNTTQSGLAEASTYNLQATHFVHYCSLSYKHPIILQVRLLIKITNQLTFNTNTIPIIVVVVVVVVQALYGSITTRQKYKGTSSMNCRERGSHARGVYPTQDTSRMGTAKVKQGEEADTRIIRE